MNFAYRSGMTPTWQCRAWLQQHSRSRAGGLSRTLFCWWGPETLHDHCAAPDSYWARCGTIEFHKVIRL